MYAYVGIDFLILKINIDRKILRSILINFAEESIAKKSCFNAPKNSPEITNPSILLGSVNFNTYSFLSAKSITFLFSNQIANICAR